MTKPPSPGKPLVLWIRARFVESGTSLQRWCRENDIDYGFAYRCLAAYPGNIRTPSSKALRARLIQAAEQLSQKHDAA